MKLHALAAALCSAAALTPTQALASQGSLPLGDGKVSATSAQQGYVYACTVPSGGGGAFQDGAWIKSDGSWEPSEKIAVQGSNSWPNASFKASLSGSQRLLTGNGLPTNHATGTFPVSSSDPAYSYDRNPNTIKAQTLKLKIAASPRQASKPSCLSMGTIGVMLNGVQFFNALDGEGRDAVAHEIQDSCDGHPERTGAYHYHSLSRCVSDSGSGHSKLLGYALDGFGLYGARGLGGKKVTNADLDQCHGHSHKLTVKGKKKTVYHYHATNEYPYTLGCFKGTPIKVSSNTPSGPQPGGPPGGGAPPGGPPPMP